MILGIGCDLVSHSVTEVLEWKSDMTALNRILSDAEMRLFKDDQTTRFLAGRFAAKEALLKSLGTGMQDGISLTDIEVLRLQSGAPTITATGTVKEIADKMGITQWHISISHSDTSSMAIVIAEATP